MASIQQVASGWRVQISIKGQRDSQVFASKRDAQIWAARRETELRLVADGRADQVHTVHDLLRRYAREVSVGKRGERWEKIRLDALERMLLNKKLIDFTPADLTAWRDRRLGEVSRGTVLREMSLLQGALEVARRDWGWLKINPLKDISKPVAPQHRNRTITWREIRAVARQLGWRPAKVSSLSQSCALALFLSLRTGMRAGEICGARWEDIDGNILKLAMTKNGDRREVPLSAKALRLIGIARTIGTPTVVGVKKQTLDALFRRARTDAGLSGFTFHDARHTAATWMVQSGRVDALTLCKIMGWRNPKFALVYFNPKMSDIARRL